MQSEELERLKHGPRETGVAELLLERWSPRSFADREVSASDLKKLFEAARWAASSYNEQPWRFIVGQRGSETYNGIFGTLIGFNQSWAKTAPVLILSVGKRTFSQNGTANRYGLHDTGAATANLSVEATALGLHTHSMGGFDEEKARAAFSIPGDFEVGAVTAAGYLGDAAALPEPYRGMEVAPRQRKPLEELVFTAWDTPHRF